MIRNREHFGSELSKQQRCLDNVRTTFSKGVKTPATEEVGKIQKLIDKVSWLIIHPELGMEPGCLRDAIKHIRYRINQLIRKL